MQSNLKFIFPNSEFYFFFNSHIPSKCEQNQQYNNVTNTVKHTIPIIISLFVFIKDVTQKPLKMKDLNFFLVITFLTLQNIEL